MPIMLNAEQQRVYENLLSKVMKNGTSIYQLACMMRFGKSALIIKLLLEQFANKRCLICCDNGVQRYNKLIA